MALDLNNQPIIFLDIETTGWSVRKDRIIEIYASKMIDDQEIESFHTLLNPQLELPRNITNITGISFEELMDAPIFSDIANQLYIFLGKDLLVAHNARFDFSFIKREFLNVGLPFDNKYLCTVKLSRKLFPEFRKHGLDHIINRFNIRDGLRHRAKYDTDVIKTMFFTSKKEFHEDNFLEALQFAIKENTIPNGLDEKFNIKDFKPSPGVYIFYGNNNFPLYIGMSKNVKKRVLDHLYQNLRINTEFEISSQVKNIETIYTVSELGAKILELALVQKLKPMYNKKLKKPIPGILMKLTTNNNGYYELTKPNPIDSINIETDKLYYFSGNEKLYDFICMANIKKYGLCAKLLDIEKTKGSCFYYKLGTCKGACVNNIDSSEYNQLFLEAFSEYALPIDHPPAGGERIVEFNNGNESERFYIKNWTIIQVQCEYSTHLTQIIGLFDMNLFRILKAG